MAEAPEVLYGDSIGSAYQRQVDTLSKLKQPIESQSDAAPAPPRQSELPALFDEPGPDVA